MHVDSWTQRNSTTLRFTMAAMSAGYVAIGWSAGGGAPHVSSDMIVGYFENGVGKLVDTFSMKKALPATDAMQDATLIDVLQLFILL